MSVFIILIIEPHTEDYGQRSSDIISSATVVLLNVKMIALVLDSWKDERGFSMGALVRYHITLVGIGGGGVGGGGCQESWQNCFLAKGFRPADGVVVVCHAWEASVQRPTYFGETWRWWTVRKFAGDAYAGKYIRQSGLEGN